MNRKSQFPSEAQNCKSALDRTLHIFRTFAISLMIATLFYSAGLYIYKAQADTQQTEMGILQVQVINLEGKPVIGALVTISLSDGTVIGSGEFTNDQGEVKIAGLTAGLYKIQVEADKYQTFNDENIDIRPGVVQKLSLQLTDKITVSDVVTVQAQSDNPVEQIAAPQAQLTQESLKTVPLQSREFDQALPTIPGVVRGQDGRVSIKGRRESQNALLINEADATDPATGNFALSIPLESIEKVDVYTNPYLPEYGKFTGGVTKVQTKRGGEKFKFEVTDVFPEPRIRGGSIVGIASFSPRLHLEGPIIKDRFYFSQGLEYGISKRPVRGLAAPDNETRKETIRSFTQLDFIISPRQTLTTLFNFSPRRLDHIGLDFFNPQIVAPNQKITDSSASGIHRLSLTDGSFLETTFQYKRIDSRVFGEGSELMVINPLGREGNFYHREKRTTERWQLRVTNTLPSITSRGVHNIKYGIDINYLRNDGLNQNQTVNIVRADGTTAEKIDYINSGDLRTNNAEISAFAQDQWLIRPNLNFNYGIRFEAQRATAGVSAMPRVALSYSPVASGNSVFRAAFGLFYDKVPLNALSFVNTARQVVTRFGPDGETIIDGPRSFDYMLAPRPNGKPNTGADFAAPRNETYSFQYDQRLNPNVLLKAAYLESRTQNDLYISPLFDLGRNSIMLFNNGRGTYRSLELTSNIKFRGERDMTISYIRSKARGELNALNDYYGDFPDPVIRPNQFSNLATDAPNRLLVRGNINNLPYGFSVIPLFDVRTGFPYSIRDESQNFIGVRNSDDIRFPRFLSLDMAINKDVRVLDKYKARFILSIFNVTNHRNPRNVRANIGDPGFGQFFASYRRVYRLDFEFSW
jgi:hypothetical protein